MDTRLALIESELMAIQLSNELFAKLPEGEKKLGKDAIKESLWAKSNARCHLCDGPLDPDRDAIVADHVKAEAEGGETELLNLSLAHQTCNSVRKNLPAAEIRPFLRLRRFVEADDKEKTYAQCIEVFGIKPGTVSVDASGDVAKITLPGGGEVVVPVFADRVRSRAKPVRYCFLRVNRAAIWNDDECQPRAIKPKQVYSIFHDLLMNPLQEPPACRLAEPEKRLTKILMFDGQHKTLATWCTTATEITIKLYVDLDKAEAIELVNSIQARIKKLPLSSLEFVAKMEDEWKTRWDEYFASVAPEEASEKGFIDSLNPADRKRGKDTLLAALIESVADKTALRELVGKDHAGLMVTEKQFTDKAIKTLLDKAPMVHKGKEGEQRRIVENRNATRILDTLFELVFAPALLETASVQEKLKAKRMAYGLSMKYVVDNLKEMFALALQQGSKDSMFMEPNEKQIEAFRAAATNYFEHPIWTAEEKLGKRVAEFVNALQKNQNIVDIAAEIHLNPGYGMHPKVPKGWAG